MLASFIHPSAVQALSSFIDLSTPEKRHENLQGKRLVILPDLGGYQQQLQSYYELVDNGFLSGRKLFSPDGYTKRWNVRFAFASVSELKIENSGDGWQRRTITLRVKNRNGKPDRTLGSKLEAVRHQIISWALAMDRNERDDILECPESIVPAIARDNHQSSIVGDIVKSFIDSCFMRTDVDPRNEFNQGITNSELYKMYTSYYAATGSGKPMGLNNFVSHLKVLLPENFRERTKKRGEWQPARFVGMKLLGGVFESDSYGQYICNLSRTVEGSFYTEFEIDDETPSTQDQELVEQIVSEATTNENKFEVGDIVGVIGTQDQATIDKLDNEGCTLDFLNRHFVKWYPIEQLFLVEKKQARIVMKT
jgi:phage/plasmid-associated DNA primase